MHSTSSEYLVSNMFSDSQACFSGTVILTVLWARPVNLEDFFMLYNLYQTSLLNTKQNRSAEADDCLLPYQLTLTGLTLKIPKPKGIIPSPGFFQKNIPLCKNIIPFPTGPHFHNVTGQVKMVTVLPWT